MAHIGTIVNSTISGNTTNSDGGGILNNGTIDHIQSTTIADNTACRRRRDLPRTAFGTMIGS